MSKSTNQTMSAQERLAIRISNMIGSPKAQLHRQARIHKLDTDPEEVWDLLIGALAESAELEVTFEDDGDVTIRWEEDKEAAKDDEGDGFITIEAFDWEKDTAASGRGE